jgi:hypothetical protein
MLGHDWARARDRQDLAHGEIDQGLEPRCRGRKHHVRPTDSPKWILGTGVCLPQLVRTLVREIGKSVSTCRREGGIRMLPSCVCAGPICSPALMGFE